MTGVAVALVLAAAICHAGWNTLAKQAGGGALIVGGVVAVVWETGGPTRVKARRSVAFGVLVGGIIGGYTLWDAWAVSALLIPPLLLDYFANLGRLVMLSPYALRRRANLASVWRDHRRAVLGVAILSPLSYILVLSARVFTPVSYVAPAREVSVLFAVLIGGQLLGEGSTLRRLLAALIMLAGIMVLAVG